MTFSVSSTVSTSIYALNLLFALIVIFVSRKTASSTWAWLFVLFSLPLVQRILMFAALA